MVENDLISVQFARIMIIITISDAIIVDTTSILHIYSFGLTRRFIIIIECVWLAAQLWLLCMYLGVDPSISREM